MCVAKGTQLQWLWADQLISEHAFLCTAHIVRRAGFRRDNAAQIVGMYVVWTYYLLNIHVYPSTFSIHW